MKQTPRIFFLMLVLAVVTLACSIGAPDFPEGVLFQDDFSSTSSGWDSYSGDDGTTDYTDGQYRILVLIDNQDYWANPGYDFEDVIISVTADKKGGPDDNDFGIICRYQDETNFYYGVISSDGYYGILQVLDGEQYLLSSDALEYSDAIHQGSASNEIGFDCIGDTLSLYANGVLLAEARDSSFTGGDVGLIAGTYDIPGTDILFDDFLVEAP